MYAIVTSDYFLRRAKKFFKKHPELQARFDRVFDDLKKDPFQSRLELHNLGGKLKDIWAVSLSYSYRITLTIMITENEILLLDIGSHDEVYR